MAWRWSAMLLPPPTLPTVRAFCFLSVPRECFMTSLPKIPIGKPQDTATPKHQRSFHACHAVEGWIRTLFQDPSPEAAALRIRAGSLANVIPFPR